MNRFVKKGLSVLFGGLLMFCLMPHAALAAELYPVATVELESLPVEIIAPGASEGDDELINSYIEQRLGLETADEPVMLRGLPQNNLTGNDLAIFNILKGLIAEVAAGQRTSTSFEIPLKDYCVGAPWSAADLGVDAIWVNNALTEEARAAYINKIQFNTALVFRALLYDSPYELYWFDKTDGVAISYTLPAAVTKIDGEYCIGPSDTATLTYSMAVSANYSASGETGTYELNPSPGQQIEYAVWNAGWIASENVDDLPYDRLLYFKDTICDLTDYNDAVADDSTNTPYGDPWQIIYVFDDNPSTNVVCEGYSKAFQYLCELADIPDVTAYSVSGTMNGGTGAGNHMWNLVRMDDDRVYLVDVTNCDSGSVGYPNKLFMVPYASGSVSAGYVFRAGSYNITYKYDSNMSTIYSTSDLTVASTSYVSPTSQNPTSGWTKLDTCEYRISNGTMTIRPLANGSHGVLPNSEWGYPLFGVDYESVTSVVFMSGVMANKSLEGVFANCDNLEIIDLSGLDTTHTTNFERCFAGSWNLQRVTFGENFVQLDDSWDLPRGEWRAESTQVVYDPAYDEDAYEILHRGADTYTRVYNLQYWGEISVNEECMYHGAPQTPSITVVCEGRTLVKGTDYTVSYSNNTNAGTATVSVTGKGSYYGTCATTFTIKPRSIGHTMFNVSDATYTGSAITPTPTITFEGDVLVKDTDYTLSYRNNVNAGSATLIVTGKGNFGGTMEVGFQIKPASITSATFTAMPTATYTGSAITPTPTVFFGDTQLVKDTDFTVSYANNVNVGTATVTVTGKGNFTGTKTLSFQITANIIGATVAAIPNQAYTGSALTPAITVTVGSMTLVKDTDYTVAYSNNVNVGTATVTISGKGLYTGSKTVNFQITPASIANGTVSYIPDQAYTGSAITPTLTVTLNGKALVLNTDYTVSCSYNVNVGDARYKISGTGNYAGTISGFFKIVPASVSSATVTVAGQTYTGSALTPTPTVKLGGKTLVKDTDYTVAYSNNVEIGTATVTITGKGNYTGTKTATFAISAPHAPGWAQEGGAYYFYDSNGQMMCDHWESYAGKWYYFGADGALVWNGWSYYEGVRYYMGKNGQLAKNTWAQIGGKYYYIGSNYQPVVNNWVKYNNSYFYMDANGNPIVNKWEQIGGTWYHFKSNGVCDQVWNG